MSDEPHDLDELPDSMEALLRRVRSGGPSEAARARIAAGLDLDPGPGGGSSAPPGSGGPSVAVAAAVAAAAAIYFAFAIWPEEPPAHAPIASAAEPTVEAVGGEAPPALEEPPLAEPEPMVEQTEPRVAPSSPRRSRRVGPRPDPPSLQEAALLLRARRALIRDPRLALSLCAEHAAAFPRGQLAHEREVLRIDALRADGRVADARSAARGFLSRHPESPHRAHLEWADENRPEHQ